MVVVVSPSPSSLLLSSGSVCCAMGKLQQVDDDQFRCNMLQLPRLGRLAQTEFTVIDEFVKFNDDTDDRGETTSGACGGGGGCALVDDDDDVPAVSAAAADRLPMFVGTLKPSVVLLLSIEVVSSAAAACFESALRLSERASMWPLVSVSVSLSSRSESRESDAIRALDLRKCDAPLLAPLTNFAKIELVLRLAWWRNVRADRKLLWPKPGGVAERVLATARWVAPPTVLASAAAAAVALLL